MKFRFTLENLETGIKTEYKTLKALSENTELNHLPYHKIRSLSLSSDKLFLHNEIKELAKKYRIINNQLEL